MLYVPDLSKKLLSVSAITDKGGDVKFTKDKVVILKNGLEVLNGEKQSNGLYEINFCKDNESLIAEKQIKLKASEWHRKLGHLSLQNLKKLLDISNGMEVNKNDFNNLEKECEVCIKSKQVRNPFSTTRSRATRPLEILHIDICGPIEPTTWDEKNYILTILDDFTHYSVVYLLKHKYEATDYLKQCIEEMEAHKNGRVYKIRCDNGGEFTNLKLKQWCNMKGIVLDYTVPHSPQMKGKAERLNRTLLEKARTLIFDSGLTKKFWGEAVYVATYLLNRSPTESSITGKTPSENWTGKQPNLSGLQFFGCKAFAKTLGYLKKLEPRIYLYWLCTKWL